MAQGNCPRCGSKVNRILGKEPDVSKWGTKAYSPYAYVTETVINNYGPPAEGPVYSQNSGVVEADASDDSEDSEDEDLRDHGYMTPAEFVKRLTPGLTEYLENNWKRKDILLHPEDLFMNAQEYLEVGYHIVVDFGVTRSC
jgi:hypothetical protein